jgi:hypothetical protein
MDLLQEISRSLNRFQGAQFVNQHAYLSELLFTALTGRNMLLDCRSHFCVQSVINIFG